MAERRRSEREWLDRSWANAESYVRTSPCLALDDCQRELVVERWLNEAEHYDQLWRRNRRRDAALRVPLVGLGATVPVLASLEAGRILTALTALAVAVLTGLTQFFKFEARAQHLRRTAVLLKHEGWAYLERTGDYAGYADHRAAHRPFLTRVEALNAMQTETYLDVSARRPPPEEKAKS